MNRRTRVPFVVVIALAATTVIGCGHTKTNEVNYTSNVNTSKQVTPSTQGAQTDAPSSFVVLENIQFANNSLTLTMTHGNMQTTYGDPHFNTGDTKQFIVSLRNTNPGKYSVNKNLSITSDWAKSMLIKTQGSDLIMVFDLKKPFSSFDTSIGGGTLIQFNFK